MTVASQTRNKYGMTSVPHGIMFHHFHGQGHHRSQGSIDAQKLADMIDFLGGHLPTKNEAVYKEASPLSHVGAHAPPYLFIDGEFDRPKVRYVDFRKRLDAHKIPNQFVLMPKGPHPFWVFEQWFEPTVDAVDAFLQKHLPAKK